MQPRHGRPPSSSRPTRPAASTGSSLGVQSMVDHVLPALGRTHDPANVRRAVDARARAAGIPTFNLDLIYGGAGESLDDWRRTARGRPRPRPAARQRLRPDRRAGHAAGRRPAPATPTTTTRPRSTSLAAEPPRGGRARAGTRSPTGPAPATSAATTASTGRWATTRRSAAPATRTATGGGSGTCARPSATSTPSTAGRSPEAAGERLDADERRLEALQLAVRTRRRRAGRGPARRRASTTSWRSTGDRAVLTVRGRLLANEVALRLR